MANSVVRLSIDSHEFDANIKRAGEALNKFFDQAKKGDRTFEVLDDDAMEVVRAFGQMETKSKSASGQLAELTKAFTDLSLVYKRMTDEEKASPVGKEITNQLGILKTRIQDTKKDLADIGQELSGSKFGQFGGIIDGIGHKMGVSANITELFTNKTALMTAGVGAAAAAAIKGAEAWAKYNTELARQDQQTQVITGLKGSDANNMTDTMRALSGTYGVDFRQAVEAANTIMTQFGVSGSEAIQLIKDGMQGMIQGDGPKLLSMIQQFAPAFRDAGVSASQLVAVIHNSEGGIFNDQNMSAIVMGMRNIRLMTKQTSDALAQLGIDGKQMSQDLNDGTLTVFDALKQVASKLKDVDSNSRTAGEVMQSVFGRQGTMAGTNLAKAIETLNTNLEETKTQTGELGEAFADLQTANEKLSVAIRECFGYDGWNVMATEIRANLITSLGDTLEIVAEIKKLITGKSLTVSESLENKIQSLRQSQGATDKQVQRAPGGYVEVTDSSGKIIRKGHYETEEQRQRIIDGTKSGGSGQRNKKPIEPLNLSDFANPTWGTTQSMKELQKQLTFYQNMLATATDQFTAGSAQQGIASTQRLISAQPTALRLGVSAEAAADALEQVQSIKDQIQEGLNKNLLYIKATMTTDAVEDASKVSKEVGENMKFAAQMTNALGSALSSIEDPGAKVAATVSQAIATVAMAYADTLAADVPSKTNIFSFIAAATAATVSMATTIASIHSATGYTEGGIVGGNNYSGDNIYAGPDAMVNSGELILNRSQQSTLANVLQSNENGRAGIGTPYVTGEKIIVGVNNYAKKQGWGELVFSRR